MKITRYLFCSLMVQSTGIIGMKYSATTLESAMTAENAVSRVVDSAKSIFYLFEYCKKNPSKTGIVEDHPDGMYKARSYQINLPAEVLSDIKGVLAEVTCFEQDLNPERVELWRRHLETLRLSWDQNGKEKRVYFCIPDKKDYDIFTPICKDDAGNPINDLVIVDDRKILMIPPVVLLGMDATNKDIIFEGAASTLVSALHLIVNFKAIQKVKEAYSFLPVCVATKTRKDETKKAGDVMDETILDRKKSE